MGIDVGEAPPDRGHERLGRIDGGDRPEADTFDQDPGQTAGPTADIENTLSRLDPCEVGEEWCEDRGVATHEPVISRGGYIEAH
jgi:hypothetical protein